MLAVALRIVRDRDVADDVVQEAYAKALAAAGRFRGEAQPSTWLHRIVVNEALMWLRRERSRPRGAATRAAAGPDGRPAPDAIDALRATGPGPLDLLVAREARARLRHCLAALAPTEREVIARCALDDESYEDYARRVGLGRSAVKTRAFRARRHLRELLEADGA